MSFGTCITARVSVRSFQVMSLRGLLSLLKTGVRDISRPAECIVDCEDASETELNAAQLTKEVTTVERHRRLADEANPIGLTKRWLGRAAFVAVVQAPEVRNRRDGAAVRRWRHRPRDRRVFVERKVHSGCQVVLHVRVQDATQPARIDDDYVIETFAAEWIRSATPRRRSARVSVVPRGLPRCASPLPSLSRRGTLNPDHE
jgi:hypothetical protein